MMVCKKKNGGMRGGEKWGREKKVVKKRPFRIGAT
jgi:hypothetical protein